MMRVLIVDDHALVRAGIALLLGHQDDMEPVGQAGTAAEAIKLARHHPVGRHDARRRGS
jgi:DNA-binding NarL/FixJ family response regulator